MRVMVIGGGVAGAAAAIALRAIGADVTVYESNPDPAGAVGSFLSLAVNGLRGLDRLGCLEPIQAAGIEVERQRLWSGTGKLLGDVPRGRLSGDPLHSVTLRRGDLVDQLRRQAQQAGAQIVTGHRLVEAAESRHGVRARFSTRPAGDLLTRSENGGAAETTDRQDGVEAEGDLLLGADGIWSTTRRIIDPAAPAPVYAGLYSVSGAADGVPLDPGVFNIVFARAGAFLHLAADDGQVWWSAQVSDPVPPSGGAVDLSTLSALFRSEETPAAILQAATSLQRPTLEHVLAPVPTWHTARMALLGDAAHPVGAGQGASMAIEDAVVLAAALTGAPTLESGLADYVQARRARTAKMVTTASANRDAKTAGPIGRRVRDVVMPIVLRHFYERATSWLYTDPELTFGRATAPDQIPAPHRNLEPDQNLDRNLELDLGPGRLRPAADAPPGPGRR